MAGIRKWDIYVLEDLGCEPRMLELFTATHERDGSPNPKLGEWCDYCTLHGIHPFFAGSKMPTSREGLELLWLTERDLLRKTVRKYGKAWWKERRDDYVLYQEFSRNLENKIKRIMPETLSLYESRKLGLRSMDEPVVYHGNVRDILLTRRLDWKKVSAQFQSATIPAKEVDKSVLLAPAVPVVIQSRWQQAAKKKDKGILKKYGQPYAGQGPTADQRHNSVAAKSTFESLRSWGKYRMLTFGDDIHALCFTPTGVPCPNVSEWFQWCRENDVHPYKKGEDWPRDNVPELLDVLIYEFATLAFAANHWKGRAAEVVLMESAMRYDKLFPIKDYQRQVEPLHVGKYLAKDKKHEFPDVFKFVTNDFDKLSTELSKKADIMLNHNSKYLLRFTRRQADDIINRTPPELASEYLNEPVRHRRGFEL